MSFTATPLMTFGKVGAACAAFLVFGETSAADGKSLAGAVPIELIEGHDFTIFGEIHGTREAPLIFQRSVVAAINAGKRPLVGLELPPTAKEVPCKAGYQPSVLNRSLWKGEFARDGRTSGAMYDLACALIALEAEDKIGLVFFDVEGEYSNAREGQMADNIYRAYHEADYDIGLILTGNSHARMSDAKTQAENLSIAERLEARGLDMLSLLFTANPFNTWACTSGDCGVKKLRTRCPIEVAPSAVQLLEQSARRSERFPWDGCIQLRATTPSLPQYPMETD